MFLFFLKYCLIGIIVAAPIGPIAMLCIRSIVSHGALRGVCVGVGSVLGDLFYAIVAVAGLTFISDFLIDHQIGIKIFGGLCLIFLGYKELRFNIEKTTIDLRTNSHIKTILESCFLTIISPMTIVIYVGLFASMNTLPSGFFEAFLMAFGIFIGSLIWWMFLVGLIVFIKNNLPLHWLERIKQISSFVLIGIGLKIWFSV